MKHPIHSAVMETLEHRALRAAVYPTAWEQYMVELINKARANPTAEAASYTGFTDSQNNVYNGDLNEGLTAGTISASAKQPVAINLYLTDSARQHSQWEVDNDTFGHTGVNGTDPGAREVAAGYTNATTWGENIAVNWQSPSAPEPTATTLSQHKNLFTDMRIAGRGHRTNMMNPTYKEVGVGIATGPWTLNGTNYQSLASTHDFAANGTTFLTGVAYNDNITANSFYTPGEGLAGVTITATRISDNQTFTTTTWSSGGYSLALPAGTYNVSGAGGGLSSNVYYNNITIGSTNIKKDFVYGQTSDTAPSGGNSSVSWAVITSRSLVVTGTADNDTINVAVVGSNYVATLNGVSASYSASLIDSVAVLALAGNDKITIGAGVTKTYLDGGDGRDMIYGGAGNDTINGGAQADGIFGGDGDDRINGFGGHDYIDAGNGNDRVSGSTGNDTIFGGMGNDILYGDAGNDVIDGGAGNDYILGGTEADTINGGANTDKSDNDPLDTRIAVEILL